MRDTYIFDIRTGDASFVFANPPIAHHSIALVHCTQITRSPTILTRYTGAATAGHRRFRWRYLPALQLPARPAKC